jgi:hypothetical protein|tara:strand:+ start:2439 stop:3131 length:693 start_codon:yes stop_codon:yes gene_type:complete
MKKIIFIAFLSASFISAQELSTTNGTVTIKSSASMNVNGLVLNPTTDHVIGNNNSITMSTTPITSNGNASMARVYNYASPSADFLGTIVYQYEDADQNSIVDADAVLEVNVAGQWQNYADSDGVDNSVTHAFSSAVQISSVTASSSVAPLTVESISDNQLFKVYPNPVVSQINIAHNERIEATIFNQLGQHVLTTQEKTIDLSTYSKGVYILKVRNLNNNNTNNFKIIKQ